MYICPICNRKFESEGIASKHLLKCWKDEHPYHQAKSAPRSEDINIREVNDEVFDLFNSFKR